MNQKIERTITEIDKTRSKISELQNKLKSLEQQRINLENEEVVALFRNEKLSEDELIACFQAKREAAKVGKPDTPPPAQTAKVIHEEETEGAWDE